MRSGACTLFTGSTAEFVDSTKQARQVAAGTEEGLLCLVTPQTTAVLLSWKVLSG